MAGKVIVSVIAGAVVAAIIWGMLYQQTHNQYTEVNSTLDRLAGNYRSIREQESLRDNAPVYALLGGIVTAGTMLLLLSAGGSSEPKRKCPYCAEWIKFEAKVCKDCGRDVPSPTTEEVLRITKGLVPCPYCGSLIPVNALDCVYCRREVAELLREQSATR